MHATARLGLLAAGLALSAASGAQTTATPPTPARLMAPPAPLPPASAASAPGSRNGLTKTVVEDDAVRIEETRLRGAPQRIVVRNKVPGAKDYEIIVPASGKDPSQETGAAGKRAWSIFSF